MDSIPIYNPSEIEPKWQIRWEADGIYHADIDPAALDLANGRTRFRLIFTETACLSGGGRVQSCVFR